MWRPGVRVLLMLMACAGFGCAATVVVDHAASEKTANAAGDSEHARSPAAFPEAWVGSWRGMCRAELSGGRTRSFAMQLDVAATDDPRRFAWHITYGDGDAAQLRPYELVIVDEAQGLYRVDEKNSIEIESRLFGDELHCIYSVGGSVILVTYALSADGLTFDLVVGDAAGIITTGGDGDVPEVLVYPVPTVQHALLRRIDDLSPQ